ncbi:thiamine phosphate synthase [Prosthecomicrobium pneumaticum]|uniref:Thiamine-phosphate pyrophosphorylase n=1 Tax=Prosthecomicrobium pneumaticum TaxID=81895 RepID=A0A7W9CVF1_9HYPH|nr:thiamine phosphate synthase [Prosthecomicrobium pneumaticum]MBB5752618.1 thiamine-phosphate pyrophosphorylase [Prosthecomicrobium pneumaticum]
MAKTAPTPFGRLVLVTPPRADLDAFLPALDAALGAGDVASLIVAPDLAAPADLQAAAARIVPIAQRHGAAVILPDDTRLVGRTGADGVQIGSGLADLKLAIESLRPERIVGAAGITTRHQAMEIGEADPDYLFFGRLDGDTGPAIHPKSFDLAAWWSALFEIPAIVMGGATIGSVAEAVEARIEFVALRRAVWEHAEGPAAAVAEAIRTIAAHQPETAG